MSPMFLALCYFLAIEICTILPSYSRNTQSSREERQHNYNEYKCSCRILLPVSCEACSGSVRKYMVSLTFVSSTILTKVLQIQFRWIYLNPSKCDQAKKENFSELKNRLPGTSLTIPKSLRLYLREYEQYFLRSLHWIILTKYLYSI